MEVWASILDDFINQKDAHKNFMKSTVGVKVTDMAGEGRSFVRPAYSFTSHFNKVASEWRSGESATTLLSVQIDDVIIASSSKRELEFSWYNYLRTYERANIPVDVSAENGTPSDKIKFIGYLLDLKKKTIQVKPPKIIAYKIFFKEILSEETILLENLVKSIGRLLFAASLSHWTMREMIPWYNAFIPMLTEYCHLNPIQQTMDYWKQFYNQRIYLNITQRMKDSAFKIIENASVPSPAINLVLQPLDADWSMTAFTDASNTGLGGCTLDTKCNPWFTRITKFQDLEALGKLPLPRRMRPFKDPIGFYERLLPCNKNSTFVNISHLEALAVCIQIDRLVDSYSDTSNTNKLLFLIGDNVGVIRAFEKMRSITLEPYLKWTESRLRKNGFFVKSRYCSTDKIPADPLSRDIDGKINWEDFAKSATTISRYGGFENAKNWKKNFNENDIEITKRPVEIWSQIWQLGVEDNLWK